MSIQLLGRRQFLTVAPLGLGGRLLSAPGVLAFQGRRDALFAVDVGLMYGLVKLRLDGTISEKVDRAAGVYAVEVQGHGEALESVAECRGVLRHGRWKPARTVTWVSVGGRESRTEATYDHPRGTIRYRARGETWVRRRLRVVDDDVEVPPGVHVDDAVSAALNFADGLWRSTPDGTLRTHVVRRKRQTDERPDDIADTYRAELVPLELRLAVDAATGRHAGLLDLSPFSSWARDTRPARVVFDATGRPATITTSMILGTSVAIRFGGA